jgi:hypothetical protein
MDIDMPSNAPFGDRVAGSMTSTLGIDNRPCLWTGGVPTAPCLDAAVFKNQAVVNVTVDVLLSVFVADGALEACLGIGHRRAGSALRRSWLRSRSLYARPTRLPP